MTQAQIDVAIASKDWHMEKFFGEKTTNNVSFHQVQLSTSVLLCFVLSFHNFCASHQGYIEDLSMLADNSVDVVVSNCVVNLSPKKELVMREVHRILKPGGEFYFSDVFVDRRYLREGKKIGTFFF